jgi:hypothetical protein
MRAGDVVGVFDVCEDETLVQGHFIKQKTLILMRLDSYQ